MKTKYRWDETAKAWTEIVKRHTEPVAPFVIQDSMDALSHPADGKYYDSKSRFRQVTKAHGYEERGDAERVADNIPKHKNVSEEDYVADIKKSWAQLESGTAPLNEYEREVCKRINENLRNR